MINGCDFIHVARMICEVACDMEGDGIWVVLGVNMEGDGGHLRLCSRDKKKKERGGPLKRGDKGTKVELLL